MQQPEKADAHYRTAQVLWAALVASAPGYVEFKENLAWVEGKLAGGGEA
ncbi:MAG: hypothetical protein IPN76_11980 [Saprospiraceae bacterium]|nr:hypothetical protein [Saprospiraceae bacterium]